LTFTNLLLHERLLLLFNKLYCIVSNRRAHSTCVATYRSSIHFI